MVFRKFLELRTVDCICQHMNVHHGKCNISISRCIYTVWCTQKRVSITDSASFRLLLSRKISGKQFKLEVKQRLHQADLHQSSFTFFLTANQCCQNTLNQLCAAKNISNSNSKWNRSI